MNVVGEYARLSPVVPQKLYNPELIEWHQPDSSPPIAIVTAKNLINYAQGESEEYIPTARRVFSALERNLDVGWGSRSVKENSIVDERSKLFAIKAASTGIIARGLIAARVIPDRQASIAIKGIGPEGAILFARFHNALVLDPLQRIDLS